MDKQQLQYLIERLNQGTATDAELAQYNAYLNRLAPGDRDLTDAPEADVQAAGRAMWQQLEKATGKLTLTQSSYFRGPARLVAAAVLLLIGASAIWLLLCPDPAADVVFTSDIAPGETGGTLTLANGRMLRLKNLAAGKLAIQNGVQISRGKDGQIVYEVTGVQSAMESNNTLRTARGEQTKLRLPDGSVVYLNAESTLIYPARFPVTGKRQVKLTGEGYFEIAKDRTHPFVVTCGPQQVEVLGTVFNINSYQGEPAIETTLLEGRVQVGLTDAAERRVLQPGQQAALRERILEIGQVNTDDVVAWKNGYFMFDNASLDDIMKSVARWYNVSIIFDDPSLKQKTFFGSVDRFARLSDLLRILQQTNVASFEIRERQVLITKRKQ